MELSDYLRTTVTAYQFAEFAAVAGNEDGVCGGALPATAYPIAFHRRAPPVLRPGFCGRTGRPMRRSNLARNASEPTGRPVPSRRPQRREGFRLGAGTMRSVKRPTRSSKGRHAPIRRLGRRDAPARSAVICPHLDRGRCSNAVRADRDRPPDRRIRRRSADGGCHVASRGAGGRG
jgi:hypothetical protein